MGKPILLITGAGGYTGKHAVNYFKDYDVIGVTRKKNESKKNYFADLTNEEEVNRLIELTKPDRILHLAGQNHVGKSWEFPVSTIQTNFMSTLYLLSAVKTYASKAKVLVVGSALQTDHSYPHPYSYSKSLQGELLHVWQQFYGGNAIFVKTTNLIGPGPSTGVCANIARKIVEFEQKKVEEEAILFLQNKQVMRDYVDVRDAVRAYLLILEKGKPGQEFEISSGDVRSLEEIARIFQEISKVPFRVQFAENKHEQPKRLTSVALKELGWKPEFDIRTSLEDTLNYFSEIYRNEGGDDT
ncbi:NAD-dependent epimerase/dehydratase family protein [Guptibacillus spartinae]|uniref:NAD-dependent epimerase/dehydratase family protein n=1 Tax=Guptibacillus spartinae TaxID=3025679 RepID=UPI00235FF6F9|nr:NAD-dependent epimerase/dehydratase family protein [Pseudalkalibacillus spartinae]